MTYGDYPDLSRVKKILVIKLRHLGDVLLTGPVFSALKRAMPQASIDAYVYKETIPMLDGSPDIHGFVSYDRNWKKLSWFNKMAREAVLLRQIRKNGYDLVINLTEGDRGAVAAKVSRAGIRVGFEPKGSFQKKIYSHIVKHCPSLRHTVERNLDAVRRIGIFPDPKDRDLFFHIPREALVGMQSYQGAILIHPTSRWKFKCWSVLKMRALIQELLKRGKRIVLTSGPDADEKRMVQEIGQGLPIKIFTGVLSLKEFGALIHLSELLICVDSVPLHLASALKKPVIALFGPTSDITWGPWRNPHARIVSQSMSCRPCYQDGCGGSKYSDCLQTLSVDAVLQAVEEGQNARLVVL